MKRRGQFTLFIIVGLVIFFVFGFALYARAKIINSQLGAQADTQLKNYLTNNAINQYVTSCLDAVTDEDIILASMQGGMFNSTNKVKNIDYIEYYNSDLNRTFNVSVIINTNYNCPDNRPKEQYIVTNEAGSYPYNCVNTYLNNLPGKYITYDDSNCGNNCTMNDFWVYSGFFGINNLPMLCNPSGANGREIVSGKNGYTCDYYADFNTSMQQLLEEKISHDINSCVNFTEILKRTPSSITKVGEVNTTITFNKGSFSVNLEYPFTILMRNRLPVTRMVDFSVDKDIPFKELYEYSYELANYDVKDVKFDVFNDKDKVISQSIKWIGENYNLYTSEYIVDILPGNISNGYINLIQVKDLNHKILGAPLTINFAVKNRRPALEYISEGRSLKYDLTTTENKTLFLSPQGYDPDEERDLTYTYSGWLENYNEYYNWSDNECKNPTSMDYILTNCTKEYSATASPPVNSWTTSKLFNDTHQNSSYNTTHNDIGLHNVKIRVYDRAGLDDFQVIRILVFDLPLARINGSNSYNDVNDYYASYEDLYILNGSESTVGVLASVIGVKLSSFLWNDTIEPFNITKDITNNPLTRVVLIPVDLTPDGMSQLSIRNIKGRIFNGTHSPGHKPSSIHSISLTVTTDMGLSNTNTYYLNVSQCLNHSYNIPAYPYDILFGISENNLTGHMMANHTCCGNTLEYKNNNYECYRVETYGMNRSFRDYSNKVINSTPTYIIDYIPPHAKIEQYPLDNDIYEQQFIRKCSGDRGNMCNGSIQETRVQVQVCQDDNGLPSPNSFSKERCVGPDIKYKLVNSSTPDKPGCVNYTSLDTFEKIFYTGASAGTGICTNGAQCSTGLVFKEYSTSTTTTWKYSCDGRCNGVGANAGQCSTPNIASCKCNNTCAPSVSPNIASPLCNGLPYTNTMGKGSGATTTLSCSGGATKYFADRCSDCGLVDKDNVCVYNTALGCSAAPNCNNIPTNSFAHDNTYGNYCLPGDTTTLAICNNVCQVVTGTSSSCQGSSQYGCTTLPECEGKTKGANQYATNTQGHNFCLLEDKTRLAICNGNCQPNLPTPSIVCQKGDGCDTSIECDGKDKRWKFNTTAYCNNNCVLTSCPPDQIYIGNGMCIGS